MNVARNSLPKMTAARKQPTTDLVELHEIVVDQLGPASRCLTDFPSEDRQGCGRTVRIIHNISIPLDVEFDRFEFLAATKPWTWCHVSAVIRRERKKLSRRPLAGTFDEPMLPHRH